LNDRPILVFDGDCGFCRFWVARWGYRTGDRIEYQPFQNPDIASRFPHIPADRFAGAVHLIEPDGRTSAGALAVFRLLALAGAPQDTEPARLQGHASRRSGRAGSLLTGIYHRVPGAATVSERAYRVVADHRPFFTRLTTLLWGGVTEPSTYAVAGWWFRRLLGVVYTIAFWSLARQLLGLIGHDGILPAHAYMDAARAWAADGHVGVDRFRMFPTVFWVNTSDVFLEGICVGGAALSVLLVAGIAPMAVLPLLWLAYLSLSVVGQEFLSYQWDALLLEIGFLAVFVAPRGVRDRLRQAVDPPRLGVGLLLWLLFRLVVGSGAAKLASGDPTWHGLTALSFHYETQPIPTPLAWYASHFPIWFSKVSTAAVLGIEIFVPLLFVAPRRVRIVACVLLVSLQALIALTGNYAFFNALTALLCLFLLDDAALAWLVAKLHAKPPGNGLVGSGARRRTLILGAIVTLPVSVLTLGASLGVAVPGAQWAGPLAAWVAPLRSVNRYGLFAAMTTTRPEIVVEGSDDGVAWSEYEFRYKAGDLRRRPPWVAPYQPRLDWQMWFAALGTRDSEPWFKDFLVRLLEGSPDVLRLLDRDPFNGRPPRYVRAILYRYRFSDPTERRSQGVWWTRELTGEYSPPLTLAARKP
jgi:predicted DCC family thiol-disulfide oxidoreductase YuxK